LEKQIWFDHNRCYSINWFQLFPERLTDNTGTKPSLVVKPNRHDSVSRKRNTC